MTALVLMPSFGLVRVAPLAGELTHMFWPTHSPGNTSNMRMQKHQNLSQEQATMDQR